MAIAFTTLLSLLSVSHAAFTLSSTLGSSMVLQRGVPTTTLWGLSTPGSVVTAVFSSNGASFNATADPSGTWRVNLPAFPASATPQSITFSTSGETSLTISDVLIGDVLLCSGTHCTETHDAHVGTCLITKHRSTLIVFCSSYLPNIFQVRVTCNFQFKWHLMLPRSSLLLTHSGL